MAWDKRVNKTENSWSQNNAAGQPQPSAAQNQQSQWQSNPWAAPKVKRQVKKWRKIKMSTFVFWCLFFALLLISVGWFILYSLMQSPDMLESMNLERETVKWLLMFFSILFFGGLFFVWFGFLISNGYRLATVKWWKWKYAFGTLISFLYYRFLYDLELLFWSK